MKRNILIIDDDFDMCSLLSRYLNQNGYETHTAADGITGIKKLIKSNFDGVLCDFRLGDIDGKEVLIALKELKLNPVFIIMTGFSDVKTARDVMTLGAYDYIAKPLRPTEILSILARAFAESSPLSNSASTMELYQ